MLRGIGDLRRFTIAATDGDLGSGGDVYVDDRSWSVRFLAVDAPDWLRGRRVLVSPSAVRSWDPTTLYLELSKRQAAIGADLDPGGRPGSSTRQREIGRADLARAGEQGGGHLQTATAVIGYAIQTEDGEIGHVKDVL